LTPLQLRHILCAVLPGWGYSWTDLPLQASVGGKLRTAASARTMRPTSKCAQSGIRSCGCGPSSGR